ncbi:MAG: putative lipid II flippase FtsW [Clostridiales Family XIII bacterium]|nr:putative lipid II flippase FtsW [Clostridiales Family XIII bacterium]
MKSSGKIDIILLILVVVLAVFGVVMVFSASYYSTITSNLSPYYYLQRAAQWAGLGVAVMVGASFVPYRIYKVVALPAMLLAVLLLAALFIPGVGENINGATRWIKVGPITFMPGEFVKLAAIFFLAWYYTKYAKDTKTFLRGFLPVAALVAVVFVLIYKEPNLSTALIAAAAMLIIMFLAGVRVPYLVGFAAVSLLGIWYKIQSGGGEHLNRISGFLDPFSDAQDKFFQTVQGLIALGSGGLTGVGLGNSVEKALWLPFAQNDFIFAIIGEETGFVGCILLMIAYLVLIWRCLLISTRAPDRFGMLIGAGAATLLAIQVILNIGVVTSVLPPTGVTLPFISYGGNAILLFMFLMGIVLNISRGNAQPVSRRKKKAEASEALA